MTNPLVRDFEELPDGRRLYHYFVDVDYTYNFTSVAVLLLAQQRKTMFETLQMCRQKQIPVFYSAADSIAIPTSALPLFPLGTRLGEFKIEAQNDIAVFVRRGLYYCGPDKVITSLTYKPPDPEKVFLQLAEMSEEDVDDILKKWRMGVV